MKKIHLLTDSKFLLLLCILLVLGGILVLVVRTHPDKYRFENSAKFSRIFEKKQDCFSKLLQMTLEDRCTAFRIGKSDSESRGLPTFRLHAYRDILSSINKNAELISNGPGVNGGCELTVILDSGGIPFITASEWLSGIMYVSENVSKIGKLVNPGEEPGNEDGVVYLIPLKNNWYVCYEKD